MAAPDIRKVVIGCWSAAGAALGLGVANHHIRVPADHAYLFEALATAQRDATVRSLRAQPESPLRLGFRRRAKISSNGEFASALVSLEGEKAKLRVFVRAVPGDLEISSEVPTDRFDDFELTGSGFKHFWQHPWEFKFAVIQNFRKFKAWARDGVDGVAFFLGDTLKPGRPNSRASAWEITSVVFEAAGRPKVVVLGDPPVASQTEYASLSTSSRLRLWAVTAGVAAGAVWAGVFRKSVKHTPASRLALEFCRGHPRFLDVVGGDAKLLRTEGAFRDDFVNGKLIFENKGRENFQVAIEAFKRAGAWYVHRAKIVTELKTVDLVL